MMKFYDAMNIYRFAREPNECRNEKCASHTDNKTKLLSNEQRKKNNTQKKKKKIMCENDLLSTAAVWCAVLWNRLKAKVSLVKACIAVYQNPAFVFVHTFFLVLFHFLMNWNFRFQKPLFCFLRRLFSIHDVMTNAWCWLLLSSHFWCQWASIRDGVSFQRSQFFAHKKLNNRFFSSRHERFIDQNQQKKNLSVASSGGPPHAQNTLLSYPCLFVVFGFNS